jgi:hypothetical protein
METPRIARQPQEKTSPLSSWFLTGGPPRFSPPRAEERHGAAGVGESAGGEESVRGGGETEEPARATAGHRAGPPDDSVQQFLALLESETRAWDASNMNLLHELSQNGALDASADTF